jgi:hypothetical protein
MNKETIGKIIATLLAAWIIWADEEAKAKVLEIIEKLEENKNQ